MKYRDFLLRLDTGPGDGCVVRLNSRAGQANARFELPPVTQEVEGVALDLQRAVEEKRRGERDLAPPGSSPVRVRQEEIGARLFKALLPDPIHSLYCRSRGQLDQDPDLGLRIKLQMSLDDPQLTRIHSLPWEYLYGDNGFLARDRSTSITRHLDVPLPGERPPVKSPLRVLVVIPRLQELPPLPNAERELQAIERLANQDSKIQVSTLPVQTLGELCKALLAERFHVLHFIGHGGFEAATGEGVLYLEAPSGAPDPVSGTVLADHLKSIPSLRLVFLNACQTARAAASAPYAGVATALLRAGIPAVAAMQFPISDQAASAFGEKLYQRLVSGDNLEAAVAEGRLAILNNCPHSPEWGTPVLFLRSLDSEVVMPPSLNWKPWIAAASVLVALWAGVTQKPSQEPGGPVDQPTMIQPESLRPQEEPTGTPPSVPRQSAPQKGAYTLKAKESVSIPQFGRDITADFYWAWGNERARLYLEDVKEPQKFIGPGTVTFKTKRGTCSLYVDNIDFELKTLTIKPLSGPC